jgi:hypothetical protein
LALFRTPKKSTSAKVKENATVCCPQRADGWPTRSGKTHLAGSEPILTAHLAEALQYRPRLMDAG